jgi:hypothetical protein
MGLRNEIINNELEDFLIRLSEDQNLLDEFEKDKYSVLNRTSLPRKEREAILSGSFEYFRNLVPYNLLRVGP